MSLSSFPSSPLSHIRILAHATRPIHSHVQCPRYCQYDASSREKTPTFDRIISLSHRCHSHLSPLSHRISSSWAVRSSSTSRYATTLIRSSNNGSSVPDCCSRSARPIATSSWQWCLPLPPPPPRSTSMTLSSKLQRSFEHYPVASRLLARLESRPRVSTHRWCRSSRRCGSCTPTSISDMLRTRSLPRAQQQRPQQRRHPLRTWDRHYSSVSNVSSCWCSKWTPAREGSLVLRDPHARLVGSARSLSSDLLDACT